VPAGGWNGSRVKPGMTVRGRPALARARGLVLVTNNLREFRRVRDLSCEDWTAEAGSGDG